MVDLDLEEKITIESMIKGTIQAYENSLKTWIEIKDEFMIDFYKKEIARFNVILKKVKEKII